MEDLSSAYYPPLPPPHQPYYPYYSHPPPPGVAAPPPPPPALEPYQYHDDYYHPHQQQQPAPYAPATGDEVRTLFVAGLPDDVKSREIYNLFRDFPGYESCHVRCTGQSSQAFAFAVFTDQQSAISAMHALNGLIFDLEKDTTLHIEMAKSNSRGKRQRADDGFSSFSKKGRVPAASSQGIPDSGLGSNIHIPGMGNSAHSTNGYTSTQSHLNFNYEAVGGSEVRKNTSAAYVPRNYNPCRTLFVANLTSRCTEQELIQVFSRCPGYLKLKMQNKRGVPVAFVDFKDEACSTGALGNLQGLLLRSSDGEGMRLEYAKSQMGLQKRA